MSDVDVGSVASVAIVSAVVAMGSAGGAADAMSPCGEAIVEVRSQLNAMRAEYKTRRIFRKRGVRCRRFRGDVQIARSLPVGVVCTKRGAAQ